MITVPNNVGTNLKTLKGFHTNGGYFVYLKINGKQFGKRLLNSNYKGFRFAVKINGKKYHFNSRNGGGNMVKLYRKSKKFKRKSKKTVKRKSKKTVKRKKVMLRYRKTVGGSKRVSSTRKSPEQSATLYRVGTVKKGNDNNLWVIKKTSNGVKRWVKK